MDKRLESLYTYVLGKAHHQFRQDGALKLAEEFASKQLSPTQRVVERLSRILSLEKPIVFDFERIAFWRTVCNIPDIFTQAEWQNIKERHFIHELGNVSNICPNYADVITVGLLEKKREAEEYLLQLVDADATEQKELYQAIIQSIDAVLDLVDRYQLEAERIGNQEIANMLKYIPRYGARTFHEALQFFRILHYTLWCEGEYHNTIGRFDQYMYPYLKADFDAGRLNYDTAFALVEEFFITFNKDSDLYPGVQQGDNGQSMVLGGIDENGQDGFNILSEICLKASKELKVIDPKINLRVNKYTPLDVYHLGTELTKVGLGFPQYSNDDQVIPGLVKKGYTMKDVTNYVVAACWEFIIPGYGMDIPNIGALSFPKVVDRCMHRYLSNSTDYAAFMAYIKTEIQAECDCIDEKIKDLWIIPAPFMSILMKDCLAKGKDIAKGAKYNNFGFHGTGIATAADSLAAVKKHIFDDKTISVQQFLCAMDQNFEQHQDLLHDLRYHTPKMGNDNDYVDDIAVKLLDDFADALTNKQNERGGCYRAGTGSAMYYLWHANEIGASADGRRKGEPFGANYSPSIFAKTNGPISIVKSFVKPHLQNVMNGGPLTLEFHSTLFRDADSIEKVALLVKSFIDLGGHQLQLNAVNREVLLEAQKHPEKYRDLIVRIWGWSAYFVELDEEYQNHVINRQEYMV